MTIRDPLTSIHGRKIGSDPDSNLFVTGPNGQAVLAAGPVAASTAATIPSFGIRTLTSAAVGYTLEDPVPGHEVMIISALPAAATRFVQTSTANGVTFVSSGGFNKWTSSAAQTLRLMGVSTTQWQVISNAACSSLSTSVGTFSTI